jgi:hypothetical protein
MSNINPKVTPTAPHLRFSKEMEPKSRVTQKEAKKLLYKHAAGCLNYLAPPSRLDIAVAVNQPSRYFNNFGPEP